MRPTLASIDVLVLRYPVVAILLPVIIAYWPLSTFEYAIVGGDTFDCWLPWRSFISACFRDGHFPLWNPMQQMGYPIYADLQGPAWYVEAIALAGTLGHSLFTMQALFLLYLVIGGEGMRRLALCMHGDRGAALIIGIAYSLGGFFTGHTMHFYSVISAAWLPWLIEAQLRLMAVPTWRDVLRAAVFQYLLLSGGNHTFNILATYLLVPLCVIRALTLWREGDPAGVKKLVLAQAAFIAASIVLASGTLYALLEVAPFFTRGDPLSYAVSSQFPFTFRAALSWVMPFATGVDAMAEGTDPTMANGYMGVLVLLFAVLSLFRTLHTTERVIAIFGGICLLAAFATLTPVHRALWAMLPGMAHFRSPSYFLWGAQLSVFLLACGSLAYWPRNRMYRRAMLLLVSGTAVVVLGAVIGSFLVEHDPPTKGGLFQMLHVLTVPQRILVNSVVLLPVIGFTLLGLLRGRLSVLLIGLLVVVEMVWSTGLSAWNTSISDVSPFAVQARISALPKGPIVPRLTPMGQATDGSSDLHHLWRNTQVFRGQPTYDGFNSFQLKHTSALLEAHPRILGAMQRRPLLYLADTLVDRGSEGHRMPLEVEPSGTVELISFSYDRIQARINSPRSSFLMVQQAWFPGWHILVDGHETLLERANVAAFGAEVPAGAHRVDVEFRKPLVPWLLGISMSCLFLTLGLLFATGPHRIARLSALSLLFGMVLHSIFGHRSKAEMLNGDLRSLQLPSGVPVIVNTDRPILLGDIGEKALAVVRCDRATELPALYRVLDQVRGDVAEIWCAGLELPPGATLFLKDLGWRVMEVRSGKVLSRYLLERQAPATDGALLFQDAMGGGEALCSGDPYSAAFIVRVDDLSAVPGELLVVDLWYKAHPGAHGKVVVQRKREGVLTSYEAVPFQEHGVAGRGWVPIGLQWSRAELRDPEEELSIFLWNNSIDTVVVRDLRVRLVDR